MRLQSSILLSILLTLATATTALADLDRAKLTGAIKDYLASNTQTRLFKIIDTRTLEHSATVYFIGTYNATTHNAQLSLIRLDSGNWFVSGGQIDLGRSTPSRFPFSYEPYDLE